MHYIVALSQALICAGVTFVGITFVPACLRCLYECAQAVSCSDMSNLNASALSHKCVCRIAKKRLNMSAKGFLQHFVVCSCQFEPWNAFSAKAATWHCSLAPRLGHNPECHVGTHQPIRLPLKVLANVV